MTERTIVVISSGLGQPSATRMLADRLGESTQQALAETGVTARVVTHELREVAQEVVNAMLTGFPVGGLRTVFDDLDGADALIAVTPIFTTSYSGLFKSFVDVIDKDALAGLPVLLGATGGTPRHSLALDYAMRPLFTYLHAEVVPTAVYAATDDWAATGDADTSLPDRIDRAGRELASAVASRPARQAPDPFALTTSFEAMLAGAGSGAGAGATTAEDERAEAPPSA